MKAARSIGTMAKGNPAPDPFMQIYITALSSFIEICKQYDPAKEPQAFHAFLHHAFDHFGMTAAGVVGRTGATKATVSKWRNNVNTPNRPTIETVVNWMIDQGMQQIKAYNHES